MLTLTYIDVLNIKRKHNYRLSNLPIVTKTTSQKKRLWITSYSALPAHMPTRTTNAVSYCRPQLRNHCRTSALDFGSVAETTITK